MKWIWKKELKHYKVNLIFNRTVDHIHHHIVKCEDNKCKMLIYRINSMNLIQVGNIITIIALNLARKV
jgi:hypothetical protein